MTNLPERKLAAEELGRLRLKHAMAVRLPLAAIKSEMAGKPLLCLGYLLCLAGGVPGLLVAMFIALRRRRSRHHAVLMFIVAALVLLLGILYQTRTANAP